ncbi:uncharacterized protein Z519_08965 [Cladophialophora bantiana CBS 173.52]|uniref:Tyrosinase copper-binding domain-containing protein n=1 Tax=Cladophialophora bantiana (strain ATCC 10958 / CBS 173.52 / CDC B-1940 / NIH 8579) TaxID=1442370 RepID=A0A0D2EJY3_CLAB1|nr:uncharacterized protein Z519_08965 [Cladophialophora bantiana CBS 173.52]KIW90321.1 hypothetical protein Z519_08965 [Cladophialophora bantiana CBS 173.52]
MVQITHSLTLLCSILLTLNLSFASAFVVPRSSCQSPRIRKEYGSLSTKEKKAYISAVKCLQSKPSKFPAGVVPGSKSRYDDFAAVHINQTTSIHLDGIFLGWHREFVWLWETALIQECGYTGAQPYWDWPLWAHNLSSSPLFDGSDTSLGGDGYYDGSFDYYVVGVKPDGSLDTVPRGTGGGCVKSGPFKDVMVNLGPFEFTLVFTGLPSNWTAYNPHCLLRDLNQFCSERTNQTYVDAALATTTIADFQNALSSATSRLGVHGNGHFALGQSLQDFFASPQDPAFFLHHGQIDRLWYQWQKKDLQARTYGNNALNGTSTIFDPPTAPGVTFDTTMNWGILGGTKSLGDVMSPTACGYCYQYQ